MTAKAHYDNHLGVFYSWMTGDFQAKCNEFRSLLKENGILPKSNKMAIDLGAGHGLQSIPLAEAGFQVLAVDFNQQLLNELKVNAKSLNITPIHEDMRNVAHFADNAELIVCCGDTLAHLDNHQEVKSFIENVVKSLDKNGIFILSFRDYSTELTGTDRFIPVKSDEDKILTCILDYEDDFVNVTDLFYERINTFWVQKVSSYKKVRLLKNDVVKLVETNGMTIHFNKTVNGITTIIASKGG